MPPVLHLVRHAQGYHEIMPNGHQIHDPAITPKGRAVSLELRERFPYHDEIDLVCASPMRRAIETALVAFPQSASSRYHENKNNNNPKPRRVLALPDAQEATDEPCDTGSDRATLATIFSEETEVDLSLVYEGWNVKAGVMGTDVKTTKERARRLRNWIKARPESQIVVVSHGNFAHYLTGDVDEKGEQTTPWWINDEFRTFTFASEDEQEEDEANAKDGDFKGGETGRPMARLIETEDSVKRRPKASG